MLDLVFINDQAPALNADNMNRIVNEINKTDAKANDLQSEIATLVIEKGGSIVQANPEEIPPEAEELNRLRINDKVYNISTESLNERITELDEKIDTDVSQLQDSIDAKVTQLTFETGIDIGDWEAVMDPDEPVIYERYMNYHDAVAKLSQQIDIMGARTDTLKTSLNELETDLIYKFSVVYGYNGNLNDLPAFSVAECLNSCTNLPFGTLHSTVITIRMAYNPNFAHQLCISGAVGHDRSANFMALRTKWSGSWGNWVTIK